MKHLHSVSRFMFTVALVVLLGFSCSSSKQQPLVSASQSCLNFQSANFNPDIHGEGLCLVPGTSGIYTLMGEIVFYGNPNGAPSGSLPLAFPPNKTITELNGTLSYYSNCPWGPTLSPPTGAGNVVLVRVFTSSDPKNIGTRVPSYSWVIKNGATDGKTVYIDDHIPIPTGDGNGSLTAFTQLPVVSPACFLSVEFQGHMVIQ